MSNGCITVGNVKVNRTKIDNSGQSLRLILLYNSDCAHW